jgi:osmotically-inducible protein OsmY
LAVVGVALALGCTNEDADRLGKIGRRIAARTESILADDGRLSRGCLALRSELSENALDARVTLRLRWDKELTSSAIQVTAAGSVVELSGTLSDAALRQRAVDLAQSTVGVTKVIDSLELTSDDL